MAFSVVLARVRSTENLASPAWRDCGNKDGVSHQCPPGAVGQRHISTVWSLGAHFKDLHPLGGQSGPAGHDYPEKKAPS